MLSVSFKKNKQYLFFYQLYRYLLYIKMKKLLILVLSFSLHIFLDSLISKSYKGQNLYIFSYYKSINYKLPSYGLFSKFFAYFEIFLN